MPSRFKFGPFITKIRFILVPSLLLAPAKSMLSDMSSYDKPI
jgi:hypothetical protein